MVFLLRNVVQPGTYPIGAPVLGANNARAEEAGLMTGDVAVLVFGNRRPPRALASLCCFPADEPAGIDAAVHGAKRVIVLGGDAELAVVLTRLMRTDRLDVEVAPVRGVAGPRRALRGSAQRIPLIRDDTGTALAGSALWLPPGEDQRSVTIHGEAVVDDTVLFDGDVRGVRIEPTGTMPGLRATVLDGSRRRWVCGRAVQLGTPGARVVRDGVEGPRVVKRSTFYRHTTGWLRVG